MEEYRDDDDDDRHSIHSMATSARMPSMSDRAFLDVAMSPDMTSHAKSPFAASQLFSTHPDDTLGAIEEDVATRWNSEGGVVLRPYSPDGSEDEEEGIWTMRPNTAIPFRRPMMEDDKAASTADSDADSLSPPFQDDNSAPSTPIVESSEEGVTQPRTEDLVPVKPTPPKTKRVEFPRSDTISSDGGDRLALSRVDSNMPLIGLRSRLSSRTSQGGLTALIDEKGDGLWRERSNSFV
jgi:1-phosphatidylinositol-3-phosphate 5-kinase